ncbi:MAG: 30S ribosomal protein S2 [Candidatus Micrarchaeota archaeon]|nr:30S ribosomal protein S2 [Candidatus Micrarchaeota archaeon]
MMMEEERKNNSLLVSNEDYLESGIHIGTKIRTGDAKVFVYKKRKDGIYIIDVEKIDLGIRKALEIIKGYETKDILVVATRMYTSNAAHKLKSLFPDINVIEKRFIPGTLTNIKSTHFTEPKISIVTDPRAEKEAIKESNSMRIPVIGLVDTDNVLEGIDNPIPMNNKGRKSLALLFWLISREISMKEGKIKAYNDFKVPISFFEKIELGEDEEAGK